MAAGLKAENQSEQMGTNDQLTPKRHQKPFRFLHDGVAANGGPEEQMYEPTIPCRNGNKCKFVNLPDGCRWHFVNSDLNQFL